ncbi:MAG: ABC-2 family transporter protein [Spirochaetales bacterium]|nr:ABC-2 family transporter protein [Spirochaetales bacterium]
MNKYVMILKNGARNQLVYLPAFITRNLFFIVLIFVFFSLWRVIYADRQCIAGMTMAQVLWYFTFTENVELGKSRFFTEIQSQVKDGTIAYSLLRPYSWIFFTAANEMGRNMIRLVPMMLEGFVMASIFVGVLPGYFTALPFAFVLLVMALLLTVAWQIIIGLLAFWFEEVTPFYIIYQKLIFIIGGMFVPIDFFPAWLQPVSRYSPFAFASYWPARTFVDFSFSNFLTCLTGQLVYAVLLFAIAMLVFGSARKKVQVQGG